MENQIHKRPHDPSDDLSAARLSNWVDSHMGILRGLCELRAMGPRAEGAVIAVLDVPEVAVIRSSWLLWQRLSRLSNEEFNRLLEEHLPTSRISLFRDAVWGPYGLPDYDRYTERVDLKMEARLDSIPNRSERLRQLGRAIRAQRHAAGLTQAELGSQIELSPDRTLPQTALSRWEAGLVDLGVEQIRAVESALGVPYGTISVAANYVSAECRREEPPLRTIVVDDLAAAIELVTAASRLGLDVQLHADQTGGDQSCAWVIQLGS